MSPSSRTHLVNQPEALIAVQLDGDAVLKYARHTVIHINISQQCRPKHRASDPRDRAL